MHFVHTSGNGCLLRSRNANKHAPLPLRATVAYAYNRMQAAAPSVLALARDLARFLHIYLYAIQSFLLTIAPLYYTRD
jgi:hypothetical protein